MTNEQILEAAKEAGLYMTSPERIAAVERLVAIIERRNSDRIEQLERQLAERDAEIAKLIRAVVDHVTVRSEQYAELKKYRDAPVVGYFDSEYIDFSRHNRIGWKPLIFKPGEQ